MKISDFKQGDLILITYRDCKGLDVRSAIVEDVTDRVRYDSYPHSVLMGSGQGTFVPAEVGAKPFGTVAVKIRNHSGTFPHWSPRPGDRSSDIAD